MRPDAALVVSDRLPSRKQWQPYFELASDLAVVGVSSHDRATEVMAAAFEWLAAGTRQVWVVHPEQRIVAIYAPDRSEVLSDFRLPLPSSGSIHPHDQIPAGKLSVVASRVGSMIEPAGMGVREAALLLAELPAMAVERPGPELIEALTLIDPAALTSVERELFLIAWERCAAWLAARQQQALAVMEAPGGGKDAGGDDWVREDVAAALHLSSGAAHRRLTVARALQGRLAATGRVLAAGDISYQHAAVIAEVLAPLDPAVVGAVESVVLPRAPGLTVGQLRRELVKAIAALDPAGAEERHDRAREARRVEVYPEPDGMGVLWAQLPADGLAVVDTAIQAHADKLKALADGRTADQRRADALVDICRAALEDSGLPEQSGRRPHLQVTVPLTTLLGLAEAPGELDGYGPIPASLARRLAADADWRRLVTDPQTGALLDYGRDTYRPPKPLRDFWIARDRTCRFPGCLRIARRCDCDHGKAWEDGGTTSACNCGMLCRRHHRLKHEAGWTLAREPDGTVIWTSPTGRRYRIPPPRYD